MTYRRPAFHFPPYLGVYKCLSTTPRKFIFVIKELSYRICWIIARFEGQVADYVKLTLAAQKNIVDINNASIFFSFSRR